MLRNVSLLLLLVSVFGVGVAATTSSSGLQLIKASTDEGGGDDGGESGEENGGGSEDPGEGNGGGGGDEPEEPEQPEEPTDPEPTDPVLPVEPVEPIVPEPVTPIDCPEGQVLEGETCVPADATANPVLPVDPGLLPPCDGTYQDCITEGGIVCLAGQGGHECECAEDMSDCPLHPSLPPPESPSPEPCDPLTDPNCDPVVCPADPQVIDGDCVPSECKPGFELIDGKCEQLADTCMGGPPGLDGCPPLPKCPDAPEATTASYEPKCVADDPGENYEPILPNAEDLNCGDPGVPNNIKVIGEDVYGLDGNDNDGIGCEANEGPGPGPGPGPKPPKCPPGYEYDNGVCEKEITIIINKIIKETNEGKHKDAFPDVDIIGLSVKENADAMICVMDIDSSHIECQEFAMPENKVNQDFWRVIETDSSKNYDNGNTGSSDIDDAIEDIKSQDFNELEDADNHNFGIDLAWVAINPQGDGVTCLTTDQSGKGKSLCEPFAVSTQDVSGQITEGVEFD